MNSVNTQGMDGGNAPRVIWGGDNALVDDSFCGRLRISLPNNEMPGSGSEVVAEGLKSSRGHFHREFGESYWVIKGKLEIATYNPEDGKIERHELKAYDRILIPAGISHKVINGSVDNLVVVRSYPLWVEGDETTCETLEERFGINTIKRQYNLSEIEIGERLKRFAELEDAELERRANLRSDMD